MMVHRWQELHWQFQGKEENLNNVKLFADIAVHVCPFPSKIIKRFCSLFASIIIWYKWSSKHDAAPGLRSKISVGIVELGDILGYWNVFKIKQNDVSLTPAPTSQGPDDRQWVRGIS